MPATNSLLDIAAALRGATMRLHDEGFGAPVAHIYNPLVYAWAPHATYLSRLGDKPGRVLLLGMNPGPFGMAQTGVPFGDVVAVRDWMGIDESVTRPADEHPKRRVLGFASTRREGSGQRLWGWAARRFGTADHFFERFVVLNYCPLLFLDGGGRNVTPVDVSAHDRERIEGVCDDALRAVLAAVAPSHVFGVGVYAERCVLRAVGDSTVPVGRILHPSPASPAANRGWESAVEAALRASGVVVPTC